MLVREQVRGANGPALVERERAGLLRTSLDLVSMEPITRVVCDEHRKARPFRCAIAALAREACEPFKAVDIEPKRASARVARIPLSVYPLEFDDQLARHDYIDATAIARAWVLDDEVVRETHPVRVARLSNVVRRRLELDANLGQRTATQALGEPIAEVGLAPDAIVRHDGSQGGHELVSGGGHRSAQLTNQPSVYRTASPIRVSAGRRRGCPNGGGSSRGRRGSGIMFG